MIIPVIGKGGVGKTTITVLLLRLLLEAKKTPVLLIDADPSSCLGGALGVHVNTTIGMLRDRLRDDPDQPASLSKSDWLALLAEEAMVEEHGYDLLTMGHPEGPGCYCFVNNILRDYLTRLGRHYRLVLVDCEAGQEHLSRRTTARPDRLVCVANRSRMAAETIRHSLALFERLNGALPHRVELMLNGFAEQDELAEETARIASGDHYSFDRVWVIPHDSAISSLECAGHSLLKLHESASSLGALRGWEKTL